MKWIKLNKAGFRLAYPDRWVNNIYFDTYNYDSYFDNISGISMRHKVRYRWYGDLAFSNKGSLEVKRKQNSFNWKSVYPLTFKTNLITGNWNKIREALLDELPPDGIEWFANHPMPVIVNRYKRNYFVSNNGKIRVTIDTEQKVWDQRSKLFINVIHPTILPNTMVIEVKFNRGFHNTASNYLANIPFRVTRHSKYVNAVNAITGTGVW